MRETTEGSLFNSARLLPNIECDVFSTLPCRSIFVPSSCDKGLQNPFVVLVSEVTTRSLIKG